MPKFLRFLSLFALTLCFFATGVGEAGAGRLEEIQETIEEKKEEKKKKRTGDYHPTPPSPDYDFDWFPYSFVYLPHPYHQREDKYEYSRQVDERNYSLVAGFHYFYDTEGDLEGFRGSARLRTPFGGLEGDFTRFREDIKPGHDYLNLFYLDYLFGFMTEQAIIEFGFGYTGLQGRYYQDGPNLAASLELLPGNPLVIDLGVKYSSIEGSETTDFRIGLGLVYHLAELRLGYRYIRFEGPDISGPEFGLRFWF